MGSGKIRRAKSGPYYPLQRRARFRGLFWAVRKLGSQVCLAGDGDAKTIAPAAKMEPPRLHPQGLLIRFSSKCWSSKRNRCNSKRFCRNNYISASPAQPKRKSRLRRLKPRGVAHPSPRKAAVAKANKTKPVKVAKARAQPKIKAHCPSNAAGSKSD